MQSYHLLLIIWTSCSKSITLESYNRHRMHNMISVTYTQLITTGNGMKTCLRINPVLDFTVDFVWKVSLNGLGVPYWWNALGDSFRSMDRLHEHTDSSSGALETSVLTQAERLGFMCKGSYMVRRWTGAFESWSGTLGPLIQDPRRVKKPSNRRVKQPKHHLDYPITPLRVYLIPSPTSPTTT